MERGVYMIPARATGATFIPGRDETELHRVYIRPCLLGCESYSAGKIDETSMNMKDHETNIPRLHDTGMNFRAGMKISLRHKNWGELAPAWHFVMVS